MPYILFRILFTNIYTPSKNFDVCNFIFQKDIFMNKFISHEKYPFGVEKLSWLNYSWHKSFVWDELPWPGKRCQARHVRFKAYIYVNSLIKERAFDASWKWNKYLVQRKSNFKFATKFDHICSLFCINFPSVEIRFEIKIPQNTITFHFAGILSHTCSTRQSSRDTLLNPLFSFHLSWLSSSCPQNVVTVSLDNDCLVAVGGGWKPLPFNSDKNWEQQPVRPCQHKPEGVQKSSKIGESRTKHFVPTTNNGQLNHSNAGLTSLT